jgi:hypothetical protein
MPRQKHRDDELDLPEPKAITEINVRGEHVRVQEGLGPKHDIVVIGPMPQEMTKDDLPVIYFKMGCRFTGGKTEHYVEKRILSTSRGEGLVTGGLHVNGAVQVNYYLDAGCGFGSNPYRVQRECVRLIVAAEGPNKVFIIDGVEGDKKARHAAAVLTDLGVKKDRIRFDTGRFRARSGGL